jgi:hypothetical protein
MTINDENQPSPNPMPDAQPALPAGASDDGPVAESQELSPEQKRTITIVIVVILLFVVATVASVVALAKAPPEVTAQVRDIFIILMALMSILIGMALVILIVQLARLTNLLNNEIKPILDSTNETVSHLRGTTVFLSDNLVEPVIKLNEYLAGFSQFLQAAGLRRKPPRSKPKQGE